MLCWAQELLVQAVQAAFCSSDALEQGGLLIARFQSLAHMLEQRVVSRVLHRVMDARAAEISADLSAAMAKWRSNPGKVSRIWDRSAPACRVCAASESLQFMTLLCQLHQGPKHGVYYHL